MIAHLMAKDSIGVIRADEAYSKHELLNRLGISQRFWDSMLDDGLPFCNIGHARWVRGSDVIEYMHRTSERRPPKSRRLNQIHRCSRRRATRRNSTRWCVVSGP